MRTPTTLVTDALYEYLLAHTVRENHILDTLLRETRNLPNAHWAATPEQVAFLQMLVRLTQARRVLEIGTFTGYATLAMALAQPDDGTIVTCDIAAGWSEMGLHYWREAKVDKRIERRIGRAHDTVRALLAEGCMETFDLIYLDANKANYPNFIPAAEGLLRPGGLLVADDVFWGGRVIDETDIDVKTAGVREFNDRLFADTRFDLAMVPIANGMTLAKKK
jgi:O-methyltransferase